jgi:anti-sigma factor RsiW
MAAMKLDCQKYIDDYLAAHADGELTTRERNDADAHVRVCAVCRGRLADERTLKALVRQHSPLTRTPAEVRLRIRAALGEVAEPGFSSQRASEDAESVSARLLAGMRRPQVWAPFAVAASLIVILTIFAGRAGNRYQGPTVGPAPAFDLAVDRYRYFDRDFIANVPGRRYSEGDYAWVIDTAAGDQVPVHDDLSRAYREAGLPDDVFDLSAAGFDLVGGRIDQLADGRPVTYTYYDGRGGALLDIRFRDTMAAPSGAVSWLGLQSFYEYQGFSICLTQYPSGHFVSIMITRLPLDQFISDIATTDVGGSGTAGVASLDPRYR